MKRINVIYDGQTYSISNRSLDEVEEQIANALTSGVPSWLTVNFGEGAPHTARLLIHTGIGISLSPIDVGAELLPEYAYGPIEDNQADGHMQI